MMQPIVTEISLGWHSSFIFTERKKSLESIAFMSLLDNLKKENRRSFENVKLSV